MIEQKVVEHNGRVLRITYYSHIPQLSIVDGDRRALILLSGMGNYEVQTEGPVSVFVSLTDAFNYACKELGKSVGSPEYASLKMKKLFSELPAEETVTV